jgi:hypothetical protein
MPEGSELSSNPFELAAPTGMSMHPISLFPQLALLQY